MASNFNLSNYQYTNTKFVLDGISILLKVQLADWVNLKTMLAAAYLLVGLFILDWFGAR
jgi:hypothetical protein